MIYLIDTLLKNLDCFVNRAILCCYIYAAVTIISITSASRFQLYLQLWNNFCTTHIENIIGSLSENYHPLSLFLASLEPPMAIYFIELVKRNFPCESQRKGSERSRANRDVQNILRRKSLVEKLLGIVLILSCGFLSRLAHVSS